MSDGVHQFQFGNQVLDVCFPNTGNAGFHIGKILSGQDYPELTLPGYTPKTVIDIGANIGATALCFAKRYATATCYCFEPSPASFEYLKRNVSPISRIHCFPFGLSDHPQTTKLYLGNTQCLQNSVFPSEEVTQEFEEIELRSARDELAAVITGSCVLKIDTEGCELPILRSAERHLRHVDIIYLEYHSESDRVAIEALLNPDYCLWYASATFVHRGTLSYVSKRLINQFPELNRWEIRPA